MICERPAPCLLWRAGRFEFQFPRPALIMGVLNVTPDSFSDGGRFLDPEVAVAHGLEMAAQGADLIDVGGESTRPGAEPVPAEEELRRVLPVISALAARLDLPLSIDTQKPAVARAALQAGAAIVNDVAANRRDEAMRRLVAQTGCGYVLMHMQGTPQTMQRQPAYADVVAEVEQFFAAQLQWLLAGGVAAEQVVLDVGIGFGKTVDHNLELLANLERFTKLKRPLLIGLSRKSFLGKLLGLEVQERLPASVAGACWAVVAGAHVVRAHDVAETRQAVRLIEAIRARHV
jgi:dihydropteroate synthase